MDNVTAVGVNLFLQVPPDKLGELAVDAFGDNFCMGGTQMSYVRMQGRGWDSLRYTRWRKTSPQAYAMISDLVRKNELDIVEVSDQTAADRLSLSAPVVKGEINFADVSSSIAQRIQLLIPEDSYNNDEFIDYLRIIAERHGVMHGACVVGIIQDLWKIINLYDVVYANDYLTPDGHFDVQTSLHGSPLDQELRFYECHRDARYTTDIIYTEYIPRAEWITILSPCHVEALGEIDDIRRLSGCYAVEQWGDNLMLQLTASPWEVTREALLSLNSYLEKLRVPGSPSPSYASTGRDRVPLTYPSTPSDSVV